MLIGFFLSIDRGPPSSGGEWLGRGSEQLGQVVEGRQDGTEQDAGARSHPQPGNRRDPNTGTWGEQGGGQAGGGDAKQHDVAG
ncbi:hypothetical protein ACIA8C_43025 [Nocardia sp. NPDC051321]|uniref:hypothetical protein n=1 Tax=Nocardia sp. NPDC051321 TaxID=3364323 RepID=UPI0037A6685B